MNESKLKKLFDYQSFSRNKRIEDMVASAEARYGKALSDEELFGVNAAGEFTEKKEKTTEK